MHKQKFSKFFGVSTKVHKKTSRLSSCIPKVLNYLHCVYLFKQNDNSELKQNKQIKKTILKLVLAMSKKIVFLSV